MNMEKGRYKKIWLGILIGLLGLAVLLKGYEIQPVEGAGRPGSILMLNGRWEEYDAQDGSGSEFRYVIPEDTEGTLCFSMKSYLQKFQIFLDGEQIYSFEDIYGVKGEKRHLVRLPEDAPGKMLSIKVDNGNPASGAREVNDACLGEESEVMIRLLLKNLYALVFGTVAFLLGGLCLTARSFMREKLSAEMCRGLTYLSMFILATGIWVVTDSELLLFVTGRAAVVSLISFCSFMIMPAFLLLFIIYVLGRHTSIEVLSRLFFAMAAVYAVNYLVLAVPGYLILLPVHVLCACAIVFALKIGYEEVKIRKNRAAWKLLNGFWMLSLFCGAAFVLFYINPAVFPYSILYCVGIALFIICLLDVAFGKLYEQVEKNASVAMYKQLAYRDVMTNMENRASFMKAQKKNDWEAGTACVLMDINNLKRINDRYGHLAGDMAIIAAARCIREAFGGEGKCYRIGGDEFVVLLKQNSGEEAAQALTELAKKIQKENEGREIPLSIAAGYAVYEGGDDTPEQLFKRADADMYMQKQRMKAEGNG